jgi:hypothetical protein
VFWGRCGGRGAAAATSGSWVRSGAGGGSTRSYRWVGSAVGGEHQKLGRKSLAERENEWSPSREEDAGKNGSHHRIPQFAQVCRNRIV